MNLLRHVPNLLTVANLVMGVLGVISMANGLVDTALLLIAGGLVADVLDGMVARWLKVDGALGVQLDSLADLVTFGVLPAMMLFYMGARFGGPSPGQEVTAVFAALFVGSTAVRLARFNIDTRPRQFFYGLPTPAGAIFIAAWMWAQWSNREMGLGVSQLPWLVILVPVLLGILYQAPLRLPSLKSAPGVRLLLIIPLVVAGIGFAWAGPIAISAGIAAYVLIGLVNLALRRF
jgi:CDP-diacylglycerol--serine O-phosphatidyltransferase